MDLCAGAWAQIFFTGILYSLHNESFLSSQISALSAAQAVIVDTPMQNGAITSDDGFCPLREAALYAHKTRRKAGV